MARLIARSPDGREFQVVLTHKPQTFGRSETCDCVLRNDAEVSRVHAEIWVDGENRVQVLDKGSKNGTRVDDGDVYRSDQRVAWRTLRVGEHEFDVKDAARPPDSHTPRGPMFRDDPTPRDGDTVYYPSTRAIDLSGQRLGLLIRLAERIGGAFDRKQMLEQALDACCDSLGFERGLIVLKTRRGDAETPVTRNMPVDSSGSFRVSRTLINRALVDGERAIVNNPATDVGPLTESLVRYPICSALCVPITNRDTILGVIYGDRVTQASSYQAEDVDFLAAIAQHVGVGLANLELFREYVRSQKVYAELDQARAIQRELLPNGAMERGRLRIDGFNQPSSEVSGDYYDYFVLDDGRVGFIIADVTGHGLPAALVMANLQSAVRVALTGRDNLPGLARRVNQLICQNTSSGVFVTSIFGVVDPDNGELEYISAGHPGPILFSPSGLRLHQVENSLPLGVDEDEEFDMHVLAPSTGVNAALFYTDGLFEAADASGKLLGMEPILSGLNGLGRTLPAALIEGAKRIVHEHLGTADAGDDMTLLALEFQRD
ncbi:MAG: SpoIIE family protein phosphatase [Phycisphaerales bacterium]|nr:SpoIIE family protein phosphatase [Phycisphaerales bacterium]